MKQRIFSRIKNGLSRIHVLSFLAMFAVTVALISVMTGSLFFTNTAHIIDKSNNVVKKHYTLLTDPYSILKEAGVDVGYYDEVSFTGFADYTTYITVERSHEVSLNVDGKTYYHNTTGSTVSEILEKFDIVLGEYDKINCTLDSVTYEGMTIEVTRIKYDEKVVKSVIEHGTEYVKNKELLKGKTKVVTEGKDGERTYVYQRKFVDGVLTDEMLISDTVSVEPITEVIEQGTYVAPKVEQKIVTGKAISTLNPDIEFNLNEKGIPEKYIRVLTGKATSYIAPKGARTATGRLAQVGVVAVNPNVIPYGSKLYIVSKDGKTVYGYAIAGDTGGALKSGSVIVDVYVPNLSMATQWGARQVNVYVLEEG